MIKTKAALAVALLAVGTTWAAGGHHGVDDASIKDAGQCEQETWISREPRSGRLLHAGANCSIGPVELGFAGEYARRGAASQTDWALEAKWATRLSEQFSVGLGLQPAWQARARPRYQGTSLTGLATWAPHQAWSFHANLGRDFVHGGRDEARGGVAVEWNLNPWSLVAERYREQATHFIRGGARWAANERWTLDVTRSHRLTGPAPSAWTLGLTYGFGL